MSSAVPSAHRLYRHARRLVHPCVDAVFAVTYLPEEIAERKRCLDPMGTRQVPEPNGDTNRRVIAMASALGIDPADARRFLAEARDVHARFGDRGADPGLASPMCYEDRYTTYVMTRAFAPEFVVETGIAYGVSSTYILAAMERNGRGSLTSIEILDDPKIGQLVPLGLRGRWKKRSGDSLSILPEVLADQPVLDMFVHDSFHHHRHMWREFELAWSGLTPGGTILAHDILENNAFRRFVRKNRRDVDAWSVGVNCGVIRKRT